MRRLVEFAQCILLQGGEDGEGGRNRTAGERHHDPDLTLSETKGKGVGRGRNLSGPKFQPGPANSGFISSIKRSFLCLLKRFSRFSRRMADNTSDVISKYTSRLVPCRDE